MTRLLPSTEQLTAWGYSAAWAAIKAFPDKPVSALADFIADRAFSRQGKAVRQYARNQRRVLGDRATPALLATTVRAGLRSYARYWLETFRLESMDPAEVVDRSLQGTIGLEYVRDAVESGRGVVVVLPHSGNWDVAALMVTRTFGGLTTVAERLRPESLYDRFVAYRESLGMEILPLTGGAVPASQVLKDRLRAGKIVCLLGDRDLTRSGVPVTFFGEATRMPAGPALLAAQTGADLCPVHLTFTADGWANLIRPPMPLPGERLAEQVRTGTQALADIFAVGIAGRPQDWHMLQPLWLADLSDQRRAALKTGDRA